MAVIFKASFTTAQETKLAGIEAGAEVNVNADWNAVSGDAQILNKPTLGTMSAQNASSVAVTGGTINGATIGGTTAAAGSFSTLSASSGLTLSGGTAYGVLYLNGSKAATSGSALVFNGSNLGIGTSSPTPFNTNARVLCIEGGANASEVKLTNTLAGTGGVLTQIGTGLYLWNAENNSLLFGTNNTERMRITSGGEVYIAGTTDQGAFNLQVNGTGVWAAGAYVNGSDIRLKENIQPLDSGLDVIMAMRPVTFQYKKEYSQDRSVQPGFIAQELQEAMIGKSYLDGLVQSGPEHLNVAYQNIIPLLTKAMQEQQEIINELKAKVAVLENQINNKS